MVILWGLYYNIALFLSFENTYKEKENMSGICEVVGIKEEKQYYDKYIVKVKNTPTSKNNTKLIIYLKKRSEYKIGDILYFEGEFRKADGRRNYNGFNYRNYLKQNKIYGILIAEEVEKVDHTFNIIGNIKQTAHLKIEELYKDEAKNFLKGILFGDSGNLSEDIKEDFRSSNISHILAISGMHVSYVVFGIELIMKNIIGNKKTRNFIEILILMFYAILTGLSPSCVRACIMTGMLILSSNIKRKNNVYISMVIAFIIIIMSNIYNLTNIGMWLSFFSTLGIVVFYSFFKNLIKFKIKKLKFEKLIDVFLLSVSAQILIFPLIVFTFNTLSFTFFIANIFIYFLIGPIIAIGYISIFVVAFSLELARGLALIETFLINVIFKIAEICGKIPFSKIYVPTPSILVIIIYYLIMFYLMCYFNKNKIMPFRIIFLKRIHGK